MLCQKCQKHKATVVFAQIVDQQKTVHHFCNGCAEHHSGAVIDVSVSLNLKDLRGDPTEVGPVCPDCEQTFADFQKTGMFGCAACYEAFDDKLEKILKRVHGVEQHVSLVTSDYSDTLDLSTLKRKLEDAVAREAFEEAANLRDEIAALREEEER